MLNFAIRLSPSEAKKIHPFLYSGEEFFKVIKNFDLSLLAYDSETDNKYKPNNWYRGMPVAGAEVKLVTICDGKNIAGFYFNDPDEFAKVAKWFINDFKGTLVGHNLPFDFRFLYYYAQESPIEKPINYIDTYILANLMRDDKFEKMGLYYVANKFIGGKVAKKHTIEEIVKSNFNPQMLSELVTFLYKDSNKKQYQLSNWYMPGFNQVEYALKDVVFLLELLRAMKNKMGYYRQTNPGFDNIVKIEHKFGFVKVNMELTGMQLDVKLAEKWRLEYELEYEKRKQELNKKYKCNVQSSQQLKQRFSEILGKEIESVDKKYAKLHGFYEQFKDVYEFKELKKSLDKINELLTYRVKDRIYPNFNQFGAVTGRLSATNPNVLNLKRPGESDKPERRLIIGDLIDLDFPQIELRIAAFLVKEPTMLEAFKNGVDLHSYTAVFVVLRQELNKLKPGTEEYEAFMQKYGRILTQNLSWEELREDLKRLKQDPEFKKFRQAAKPINFGFIYGMGAKTFREYAKINYGIDITLEEAYEARNLYMKTYQIIDKHLSRNAKLHKWQEERRQQIILTSRFGRRLTPKTFTDFNNFPVQATGADMLKLCAILAPKGIVNLIHDEILAERVYPDQEKVLKEVMEYVAEKLTFNGEIPTPVDYGIGSNWAEAK